MTDITRRRRYDLSRGHYSRGFGDLAVDFSEMNATLSKVDEKLESILRTAEEMEDDLAKMKETLGHVLENFEAPPRNRARRGGRGAE